MQVAPNVNSALRAVSNSALGDQVSGKQKHSKFSFQIRTLEKQKPLTLTYFWLLLVHIPY